MKKIQLSDVLKKDLRIISFLLGTWAIGLIIVYFTKDEALLGLIPILNYLAYRIEQELKDEGYYRALE